MSMTDTASADLEVEAANERIEDIASGEPRSSLPVELTGDRSAQYEWADRIKSAWHKSVEGIIECGRLLIEAQDDVRLRGGQWQEMVETLPFSVRTAQRLVEIARNERLTDATHVSLLPPHWGTLHALTKLDSEGFEEKLADGTINPDMTRADAKSSKKVKPEADPLVALSQLTKQSGSAVKKARGLLTRVKRTRVAAQAIESAIRPWRELASELCEETDAIDPAQLDFRDAVVDAVRGLECALSRINEFTTGTGLVDDATDLIEWLDQAATAISQARNSLVAEEGKREQVEPAPPKPTIRRPPETLATTAADDKAWPDYAISPEAKDAAVDPKANSDGLDIPAFLKRSREVEGSP